MAQYIQSWLSILNHGSVYYSSPAWLELGLYKSVLNIRGALIHELGHYKNKCPEYRDVLVLLYIELGHYKKCPEYRGVTVQGCWIGCLQKPEYRNAHIILNWGPTNKSPVIIRSLQRSHLGIHFIVFIDILTQITKMGQALVHNFLQPLNIFSYSNKINKTALYTERAVTYHFVVTVENAPL